MFTIVAPVANVRIVCLSVGRYSEFIPCIVRRDSMKKWQFAAIALLGIIPLSGSPVLSQGNGQGHGHGKGHDKHHDDDDRNDRDAYRYDSHQQAIRGWYSERGSNLPPGLAKKDRLPPGLEKQLVRNGTLPPGLQKRLYPAPVELERRLPPPPPDCAHVLISGHVVLLNRKTNLIVDVFAF
jgi:hypothetical protein